LLEESPFLNFDFGSTVLRERRWDSYLWENSKARSKMVLGVNQARLGSIDEEEKKMQKLKILGYFPFDKAVVTREGLKLNTSKFTLYLVHICGYLDMWIKRTGRLN
jgi:hypothetical protein